MSEKEKQEDFTTLLVKWYLEQKKTAKDPITSNRVEGNDKKIKQLLFSNSLKEPIVELGRITYKSSGISLYLPKSIVNVLNLNKEEDNSLVIFSVEDKGFFLIKDRALAEELKPKILDLRKELLNTLGDR